MKFVKGHKPHNLGKKLSLEEKRAIGMQRKGYKNEKWI